MFDVVHICVGVYVYEDKPIVITCISVPSRIFFVVESPPKLSVTQASSVEFGRAGLVGVRVAFYIHSNPKLIRPSLPELSF